jgi:pyruvate dehydrogenase (quinone)/pyruvate oxidase
MATTAADVLVETLMDWDVDVIFGLPGDGINGIMEALRIRQDKIRFIQCRHEESAAFMACAYAKFTGKLGVCLATSGPGGIHLLNGLYDAKLDGQPVLALTGLQFHDLVGTFTQQDVALDKLFMDVAAYNERIMGPAHVENVVDLACRTSLGYRTVSHITFPVDLQELEAKDRQRSKRNVPHHTSHSAARGALLANDADLDAAAKILNEGKKVAILAGRGALGAAAELEQTAARLGAPIVKALLGKAVIADDSPYTTGGIGLLGTKPSQDVMEGCDTLLMVGTSFPYIEFLPKPKDAKGVQIELDPKRIGLRFPVEVGLVGDSRRVLQELLPRLTQKEASFLEKAQKEVKAWRELIDKQGTASEKPMKPQVVAHELGKRLRSDAIVSADSGTITTWWARNIPVKDGQMHTVSGNLATMACGLPYTIAAQIAYPDRQCIGFVGDGGFSILMAEFVTAVKYKLPIKIVIIKNGTLGQIKWEQIVFLGNPEYAVDLQPIDFAAVARACGGAGFSVEDPADCGRVMDEFLNTAGPAVLQAAVDPYEPPMPAKITADQAIKFAESLARGEPNRKKIAWTAISDKVRELV